MPHGGGASGSVLVSAVSLGLSMKMVTSLTGFSAIRPFALRN